MGYVILNLRGIPFWYYAIAVGILLGIFFITKKIPISLLITYMFLILVATTLARSAHPSVGYDFRPFASYKRAVLSRDMWWQVVCNVGMSIPIGVMMPVSLMKKNSNGKKLLITLLVGTAFSVFIEALQFVLHRGYSETDDVISSVIGIIIGFIMYAFMKELNRMWSRKNKSAI